MSNEFQNKLNDLNLDVEQYSREAGKKIGNIAADLTGKSEDYLKSGKSFVQENPVQSALIAAGVGLVVGSLLTIILKKNKN